MAKLKPCPRCGSEDVELVTHDHLGWKKVERNACAGKDDPTESDQYANKRASIKDWNAISRT